MKLIAKAALWGAIPILGAAVASYAEPTITKAPVGKIQSNVKVKVSKTTIKTSDKKSPRDLKVISSDKVIIKSEVPSIFKPVPSFRIKYPPNNIWVKRGTGIYLRGTAKNANGLVVETLYDGIRYLDKKLPGTNVFVPDNVGKTFSREKIWGNYSANTEYKDGQYQWVSGKVDTGETGRSPGPWRSRVIPQRVYITVYSIAPLSGGGIKPDTPHTQTITVDIRD